MTPSTTPPARSPAHLRHRGLRHRDHSLAVILFMMALVFAPAAAMHLAALFAESASAVATAPVARAPG